jgi:hypothetical protein
MEGRLTGRMRALTSGVEKMELLNINSKGGRDMWESIVNNPDFEVISEDVYSSTQGDISMIIKYRDTLAYPE